MKVDLVDLGYFYSFFNYFYVRCFCSKFFLKFLRESRNLNPEIRERDYQSRLIFYLNQKCLNSMIFLELDTNPLKFQIRETHEEDRKGDYTRFS